MTDDTQKNEMNYNEIAEVKTGQEEKPEYAYGEAMAGDVTAIYDIPVQISAVLGRSTMQVSQLLKLGRARLLSWTARSVKRLIFTSITVWLRAAKSSLSKTSWA